MTRTTTEVIEDHLVKRLRGQLKKDVETNYAKDVVMLSAFGTFRGHDGIVRSAEKLDRDLGQTEFVYNRTQIEAEYAMLEWSAKKDGRIITTGADAFVVRDGRIVLQTVHYNEPT
jgi:hypothetical protein